MRNLLADVQEVLNEMVKEDATEVEIDHEKHFECFFVYPATILNLIDWHEKSSSDGLDSHRMCTELTVRLILISQRSCSTESSPNRCRTISTGTSKGRCSDKRSDLQ